MQTLEEFKDVFIDFLLDMRTNNNLLHLAVGRANELNKMLHAKEELQSRDFKLKLLEVRY